MTVYLAYREVTAVTGQMMQVLLGVYSDREQATARIVQDDTPSRSEALRLLAAEASYRIIEVELDQ
jgi:hypothetical protein